MKSYPNVNPTDAEMVILKTEKRNLGIIFEGGVVGRIQNFSRSRIHLIQLFVLRNDC